jgi:ABC-type spermidine/putrescine transport system permease subunit I
MPGSDMAQADLERVDTDQQKGDRSAVARVAHALRPSFLPVVPSFAWTLLFFLAPLGILIVYSFATIDIITLQLKYDWTIENYRQIGDALYREALLRSLLLSVTATLLCLVIGFPVAYWITLQPRRRQLIALLLIIIPFWTSFLVRTYAFATLIANGGPLEDLAHAIGLLDAHSGLNLLYTRKGIAAGIVYSYLPLMILPLYVALERIDPRVIASARDLGASPHRVMRRVVIPLAMPGIVAGCILVGIPATGEYVIPSILGGGKTLMFGNVVASQFLDAGNIPFGSALAVALMVGVTIVALLGRKWVAAREEAVV